MLLGPGIVGILPGAVRRHQKYVGIVDSSRRPSPRQRGNDQTVGGRDEVVPAAVAGGVPVGEAIGIVPITGAFDQCVRGITWISTSVPRDLRTRMLWPVEGVRGVTAVGTIGRRESQAATKTREQKKVFGREGP